MVTQAKTCHDCGRTGTKQFTKLFTLDGKSETICSGRTACQRRAFYQLTPEQRAAQRREEGSV